VPDLRTPCSTPDLHRKYDESFAHHASLPSYVILLASELLAVDTLMQQAQRADLCNQSRSAVYSADKVADKVADEVAVKCLTWTM
jgi:hypothetical protein